MQNQNEAMDAEPITDSQEAPSVPLRHPEAPPKPQHAVELEDGEIHVSQCPVCGDTHMSVQSERLTNMVGICNRYYLCPKNGEPVLVAVAVIDNRAVAIPEALSHALAAAFLSGKYWVVVFNMEQVRDGQRIRMNWTTNDFPKDRMAEAVDLLAADNNLKRELDMADGRKIKIAEAPPDVMKLFGSNGRQ